MKSPLFTASDFARTEFLIGASSRAAATGRGERFVPTKAEKKLRTYDARTEELRLGIRALRKANIK